MADETKAEYDGTMGELYSIAETIFDNLANATYLSAFAAYKAKYTDDFVEVMRDLRSTAMAHPDEEARNAIFKELRLDLIPLGKTCCKNYQLLKGYIKDSFTEDQHSTQWDAAGGTLYESAADKNWENIVLLNNEMTAYVALKGTVLANNLDGEANMPTTFPTKIGTDTTAFSTKYAAMKVARQTSVETAKKIKANNNLYNAIIDIWEDAKLVFDDVETMKLFTYGAVKLIVSPPGSASYKVTVKKNSDDTALEGAIVVIKRANGAPLTAPTNAQGVAEFADLDPAGYTVTITATGYQTETFNKEVNTGTSARSEVFMEVAA